MENLLRIQTTDSLIKKALKLLPISGTDCRLKKTIFLHTLQSHLITASLSETSLKILEFLEELYHNDNVPISNAMRSAYCAVAIECTVKYLIHSPEDPSGEYFSAVKRIWRGNVANLSKEGRRSELRSEELVRWGEEVEGALWDVRVAERLVGLNTRRDAVNEMKRFLKEAWEVMGLPVLESMVETEVVKVANGLCTEGVCEIDLGGGSLNGLGNEKMHSLGHENDNAVVDGDVATMDENRGNEQMEGVIGTSADANHEVGGCDSGNEKMHSLGHYENNNVVVDVDDDDGGGGVARISENCGKELIDERVGTSADANDEVGTSGKRDKETRKDNPQLKHKHSSLGANNRGVKISGAEEVRPINFSILSSAEVKKVQESLKTSSMELKALVEDPLPDALHTSEVVRSKLATIDVPNSNANIGNKSSAHCSNVHRPNLMDLARSAQTFESNDSTENLPVDKQRKRRKKRRWTNMEEETLRDGVKRFGEGNWTTILEFYQNIFQYRTGGDLKDKWRNMVR